MKRFLKEIFQFIEGLFLFIISIFFIRKTMPNPGSKIANSSIVKENNILINNEDDDNTDDSRRELFKEYIHQNKEKFIDNEVLEKAFYQLIEKTFKLKIAELPLEKKQQLENYTTKKLVVNIEKQVNEKKLEKPLDLEKLLKVQLRKDIEKMGYKIENLVTEPNLYQTAENKFFTNDLEEKTLEKQYLKSQPEINKLNEKDILSNHNIIQNESSIIEPLTPLIESPDITNTILDAKSKEKLKKELLTTKHQSIIEEALNFANVQNNNELVSKNEQKEEIIVSKNLELEEKSKSTIEEAPVINKERENKLDGQKEHIEEEKRETKKEELKEKKEEKVLIIPIDIERITRENDQMNKYAKKEYQKKDLADKEYEIIENLIREKITNLENILQKPLSNDQKIKITKELDKLKNLENKVEAYKKDDLEILRISLEESIPLEEKDIINQKLKELTNEEELKRNELLFKGLENKSKQELEELEQIMIKDSFKRTLRRLEIPLFISFPFVKNKYFRRLVGGLFVFRSFGIIKNFLFGTSNPYDSIDLSYIERGSDALSDSISLTKNNIATFENLKKTTLLKYPSLLNDVEFMNDLNKIEENLYKNYESLLKQDKVVKKYFNKSKTLIRKRKKRFF